ncbi:hypothetical protein [Rheinheimera sp.]|jgi:hypothetical protein|uniref:hypothetical protein n=1 Tax=Rheinheimera sp. TaxID=1869214 RepID=UPI003D2D4F5A
MPLCRHGSLATRLCHQRVYATDNHTGDNITYNDRDAFGREVMAARGAGKAALDAREVQLAELQ